MQRQAPPANSMARSLACLLGAAAVAAVAAAPRAGSWLAAPESRSRQDVSQLPATGGPCDAAYSGGTTPPRVTARGATLNLAWPRNGRSGGVVRVAWARSGASDGAAGAAAFDQLVQSYSCFEAICSAANGCNGGGLAGCTACQHALTVPSFPDGAYTMQW